MKFALDIATNASNNPFFSAANAMGGSLFWWVAVAVIGFIGYPCAAIFIAVSVVTRGSHGIGVAIPALFGMGMMASRMGGGAVNTAGSAISSMANSSPSVPYRNYAVRPGVRP